MITDDNEIFIGDIFKYDNDQLFVVTKKFNKYIHKNILEPYDYLGISDIPSTNSSIGSTDFIVFIDSKVSTKTFYLDKQIQFSNLNNPIKCGVVLDRDLANICELYDRYNRSHVFYNNNYLCNENQKRQKLTNVCFFSGGVYYRDDIDKFFICTKGFERNYTDEAILYQILDDNILDSNPIHYNTCFINTYIIPYKFNNIINPSKMYILQNQINENTYPKINLETLCIY